MPSPQRACDDVAVWEMVLTCKKDPGSFQKKKFRHYGSTIADGTVPCNESKVSKVLNHS